MTALAPGIRLFDKGLWGLVFWIFCREEVIFRSLPVSGTAAAPSCLLPAAMVPIAASRR